MNKNYRGYGEFVGIAQPTGIYVWAEHFPDYSDRMQAMVDNAGYAFEMADTLSLKEKE